MVSNNLEYIIDICNGITKPYKQIIFSQLVLARGFPTSAGGNNAICPLQEIKCYFHMYRKQLRHFSIPSFSIMGPSDSSGHFLTISCASEIETLHGAPSALTQVLQKFKKKIIGKRKSIDFSIKRYYLLTP